MLSKISSKIQREIDTDKTKKLEKYLSILLKWNKKINLTASNNPSVIEPLLMEAIWATQWYPSSAHKHLDIGSGAGFPAIPIRTMMPGIQLDMIESRYKRVCFLETVIQELELEGTKVFHGRIEHILENTDKNWDCISWKGIKISSADLYRLKKHSKKDT